jgi:hypothetical protein
MIIFDVRLDGQAIIDLPIESARNQLPMARHTIGGRLKVRAITIDAQAKAIIGPEPAAHIEPAAKTAFGIGGGIDDVTG